MAGRLLQNFKLTRLSGVKQLNTIDITFIAVYFSILIVLGLFLSRKASASLEDYLLGGKKLPWWALGFSGMGSFLDVTGTALIISFLFMLGPRGIFVEFRGGAVLVLAVWMVWAGKWHRRSNCMTGGEWMIYRFGEGFGGKFARIARAGGFIVLAVGLLAYLSKGIGLFLSMFINLSPTACTLIMVTIVTIYTIFSGFYGVVFTDMFQSVIVLIATAAISIMAFVKVSGTEQLATLAQAVVGNEAWTHTVPQWRTSMPKDYEQYQLLVMFALFYMIRHVFGATGDADDPKYFGARTPRECGTLSFMWIWLMMFRWPMMMGVAVLGLFLVMDFFPDQAVLLEAAEFIKAQLGAVQDTDWTDRLAEIIHHPANHPQLVAGLEQILGGDWPDKLNLLSIDGTVNKERILPAVILHYVPPGFRGLILIAMIAASMSTFDSIINKAIGFFTCDIYQGYLRRSAGNRELIYISWGFGVALVAASLLLSFTAKTINDIWGWVIMGLGGGLMVPLFLRFFWWRFNGSGFAVGTVVGLTGAIVQRAIWPDLDERWQFLVMVGIGFVGSIVGTILTGPIERPILEHFYRTTRPFGFWGPLRECLSPDDRAPTTREHRNDLIALPFVLAWQITLFILPMQLIIHNFRDFWITLIIFVVSLIGIYLFWYRNLPAKAD